MSDPVTASQLRQLAENGAAGVVLHRRSNLPGHTDGREPCWCEPLVLTCLQMRAHPRALQQMLNEHYAVH